MIGFPLLLIPFAIYNMIAFLTPPEKGWATAIVPIQLQSGVSWTITFADVFLAFALLMLMFEFIKSTRHGKSFVEHFLSLCLAGGVAAEFWMVSQAGNSTFLLFVVMCFVDLFAGFAASLRRARRAVEAESMVPPPVPVVRADVARADVARAEAARVEPARAEPARSEPFSRVDPPVVRADPAVKIDPVQKVES